MHDLRHVSTGELCEQMVVISHQTECMDGHLELFARSIEQLNKDLVVNRIFVDVSSTSSALRDVLELRLWFVSWLSGHDASPFLSVIDELGEVEDDSTDAL